jgi:hypothetical protein
MPYGENPKAKGTESKARFCRYAELLLAAVHQRCVQKARYIPPGPRLGDMVFDINGDRKAFGNRHFIENLVGLDNSLIDDDPWVVLKASIQASYDVDQ